MHRLKTTIGKHEVEIDAHETFEDAMLDAVRIASETLEDTWIFRAGVLYVSTCNLFHIYHFDSWPMKNLVELVDIVYAREA